MDEQTVAMVDKMLTSPTIFRETMADQWEADQEAAEAEADERRKGE